MKFFKAFSFGVALLAVIIVAFAMSLDSKWQLEVSQDISSPKDTIFPMVNTLKNWPQWTVWNAKTHPNLKMTYEGAVAGKGAVQIWHDGNDKGLLEITKSEHNHLIEYILNMNGGLFVMHGEIRLQETANTTANSTIPNSTTVVWKLWGDNGSNLFGRLISLLFKPMIKKDLVGGLSNLKQLMENQHPS